MATRKEKQQLRDMADEVLRRVSLARSESRSDWRRDHYGASLMGQQCDRKKWHSFRWAKAPSHDARMLRLFERGNREEFMFGDELIAAGYKFRAPDGSDEFRWGDGHLGGECDGIIDDFFGDEKAITEMKTHSLKSFDRLWEKKSVRQCKREHWFQMQIYMLKLGIRMALYMAVCKNDDRLYYEVVPFDQEAAQGCLDEAFALVERNTAPEKLDAEYAPCVLISREGARYPCEYRELCHGDLTVLPERNCRTCVDSTPKPDGTWFCDHHDRALSSKEQREGCRDHIYLPSMMNADIVEASKEDRRVSYQAANGNTFVDDREVPETIEKLADRFEGKVTKSGKVSW